MTLLSHKASENTDRKGRDTGPGWAPHLSHRQQLVGCGNEGDSGSRLRGGRGRPRNCPPQGRSDLSLVLRSFSGTGLWTSLRKQEFIPFLCRNMRTAGLRRLSLFRPALPSRPSTVLVLAAQSPGIRPTLPQHQAPKRCPGQKEPLGIFSDGSTKSAPGLRLLWETLVSPSWPSPVATVRSLSASPHTALGHHQRDVVSRPPLSKR